MDLSYVNYLDKVKKNPTQTTLHHAIDILPESPSFLIITRHQLR